MGEEGGREGVCVLECGEGGAQNPLSQGETVRNPPFVGYFYFRVIVFCLYVGFLVRGRVGGWGRERDLNQQIKSEKIQEKGVREGHNSKPQFKAR